MKEQVIKGQSLTAADWLNLSKRNFRLDLGEVLFLNSLNREINSLNHVFSIIRDSLSCTFWIQILNVREASQIPVGLRHIITGVPAPCPSVLREPKTGERLGEIWRLLWRHERTDLTCTLLIATLMNVKTLYIQALSPPESLGLLQHCWSCWCWRRIERHLVFHWLPSAWEVACKNRERNY